MFKRYRAVTSLIVMLLWAALASAQPSTLSDGAPAQAVYTRTASVTSATTILSERVGGYTTIYWAYSSIGSGVQVATEVSMDNGSTWLAWESFRPNSPTASTSTSWTIATTAVYQTTVPAGSVFRLRATAYSSGTVTALVKFHPAIYPTYQYTMPVSATQTATPGLLADATASGSVTSATNITSTDASGYSMASVQFTSVGSGNTVVFEQSADNTNWVDAPVVNSSTGQLTYYGGVSTGASSLNTTSVYVAQLRLRYFRVRVSAYGSGTVAAVTTFKSTGNFPITSSVATDSGVDCCGLNVNSRAHYSGPVGWEKLRGVYPNTMFSSAARTATSQTADQTNRNWRGLVCVIDVTAIAATPSVVFTIQGKDSVSSKYFTILASAAIVGTGTTVLRVYPGLTAAANVTANDVLPRTWRIDATHADADSITYSVGCDGIL